MPIFSALFNKGKKAKPEDKFIDQFFLTKKDYSMIYKEAERLSKLTSLGKITEGINREKIFHPPVEQLSPAGLAIMSHIYAKKDHSQRQPLIASSIEDYKRLVKLIDNAPAETEVTIILQPMNLQRPMTVEEQAWRSAFSPLHKTVVKIKKTQSNMQIISMDATNNAHFGMLAMLWTQLALDENAKIFERGPTNLVGALQDNPINPKKQSLFSRQVSDFECGIFAIKDAREMNRDPAFVTTIMQENRSGDTLFPYKLPVKHLKSIQGSEYRNTVKGQAETVVTRANPASKELRKRKPRTLKETYEHHKGAYINHFSNKFHDAVQKFVTENRDNPGKIQEVINRYNAGTITPEELNRRYGHGSELEIKERIDALEQSYPGSESDASSPVVRSVTFNTTPEIPTKDKQSTPHTSNRSNKPDRK